MGDIRNISKQIKSFKNWADKDDWAGRTDRADRVELGWLNSLADWVDWADRDQTFKKVLKLKVFLITDLVTGSS